jgi:hypothetical protein
VRRAVAVADAVFVALAALATIATIAVSPGLSRAQALASAPVSPELRADLLFGHQSAAQVGAGLQIPLGYYARLGVTGAVGMRLDDISPRTDARVDVLTRFLLDPFRQSPYGLSVGGGIGVRAEPHERLRPVLLVAIDVEGRRSARGWVPAIQLGLGGGARLGLVLRRGAAVLR